MATVVELVVLNSNSITLEALPSALQREGEGEEGGGGRGRERSEWGESGGRVTDRSRRGDQYSKVLWVHTCK